MQRTAIIRASSTSRPSFSRTNATGNLDSGNGNSVMELLAELNRAFDEPSSCHPQQPCRSFATFRICLKMAESQRQAMQRLIFFLHTMYWFHFAQPARASL